MNGTFTRVFRALPVGRRQQFVVFHGHFQQCRCCGRNLKEPIDFAEGKRRRLKAFDQLVIDLCQIAPIKHVALLLAISWDLIKEIFKAHLASRLARRKLHKVRCLAVDEFAIRKGRHYMTVVIDLETGATLSVKVSSMTLTLQWTGRLMVGVVPLGRRRVSRGTSRLAAGRW